MSVLAQSDIIHCVSLGRKQAASLLCNAQASPLQHHCAFCYVNQRYSKLDPIWSIWPRLSRPLCQSLHPSFHLFCYVYLCHYLHFFAILSDNLSICSWYCRLLICSLRWPLPPPPRRVSVLWLSVSSEATLLILHRFTFWAFGFWVREMKPNLVDDYFMDIIRFLKQWENAIASRQSKTLR